jgi:hypothetical protein
MLTSWVNSRLPRSGGFFDGEKGTFRDALLPSVALDNMETAAVMHEEQ